MVNRYMRAVNQESRKRSSLQFFYLEGPYAMNHWINEKKTDENREAVVVVRDFRTDNEEGHEILRESVKSMLASGGKEPQRSMRVLNMS